MESSGRQNLSRRARRASAEWELETGRALRTLQGHAGQVNAAAVTPDGRYAVSASTDQTLKVWELESGRALRALQGHAASVNSECCTLANDWTIIVVDAGGPGCTSLHSSGRRASK
jgi:WD40 repeat protein